MVNDPLTRYELFKAEQRHLWREAAQFRLARAATSNAPERIKLAETAPNLTGLVERVIQNVWKRLGLPAGEPASRTDKGRSDLSSGKLHPASPADGSL